MPTIQLFGDIGGCPWDDECVTQENFLEQYAEAGKGDIRVEINTRGGSFSVGLLIYNTLKIHPGKVTTVNMGIAASMGLVLLQAGSERLTAPATISMMHKAQDCCYEQMDSDDALEMAEKLAEFDKVLLNIYSQRTGKTTDEINSDLSGDGKWFEAQSLIDYGLADRIDQKIQPLDISNQISKLVRNYARLPDFVTNRLTHHEEKNMNESERQQLVADIASAVGNAVKEANQPLITALSEKKSAEESNYKPSDISEELKKGFEPITEALNNFLLTPHNLTPTGDTFGVHTIKKGVLR
jgi:ATP-dependent Clp endopeptidase proteolytic subunit ClpP